MSAVGGKRKRSALVCVSFLWSAKCAAQIARSVGRLRRSTDRCNLNFHYFRFFFLEGFINLRNVFVGELLNLSFSATLLVFG